MRSNKKQSPGELEILLVVLALVMFATTASAIFSPTVVINEVMYNPSSELGGTYNEWIELYNPTDQSVSLTDWVIADPTDHTFGIMGDDTIQAGGFFILARKPENFTQYYSVSCPIAGVGISLNNNGEKIILKDSGGAIVDSVNYSDSWGADGNGHSLERVDPTSGSNDPDNWEESNDDGGTPGEINGVSQSPIPEFSSMAIPLIIAMLSFFVIRSRQCL